MTSKKHLCTNESTNKNIEKLSTKELDIFNNNLNLIKVI